MLKNKRVKQKKEIPAKKRHSISSCYGILGYMQPLVHTLIGLFFFLVLIWIIRIVNSELNSNFLNLVLGFLIDNLALLILTSITFGYGNYLYKFSGTKAVSPFLSSIGGTLLLLFITNIFNIIDSWVLGPYLSNFLFYIREKLLMFFILFLVISYIKFFVDIDRESRSE